MRRVRFLLIGGLLGVVALVGAALLGASDPASAMPSSVYRITLTNLSDPPTPISPGALVSHCEDGAFWSRGAKASPELELIAEVGNAGPAVAVERQDSMNGVNFVQERHAIGEVGPGQSITVEVEFEFGCVLSTAHMLVESNDTFVGVNSLDIHDQLNGGDSNLVTVDLRAYDAGTEQNTEPGSGFEGGQPDPSRGAANLDNGVPTDEPITSSVEWPGTQATLTIELVDTLEDANDTDADDVMQTASDTEDTVGFPNGGTAGLAADSTQGAAILTYLLGVLTAIGVAGLGLRLRQRIRRSR